MVVGSKADWNCAALGVIPRAASVLFEQLQGPVSLRSNSGLRTPTRYSMHGTQGLSHLAKQANDKNWQMKVTYVEVGDNDSLKFLCH